MPLGVAFSFISLYKNGSDLTQLKYKSVVVCAPGGSRPYRDDLSSKGASEDNDAPLRRKKVPIEFLVVAR